MKKKYASFWSDIKVLDERLTREPDSFCFARLSAIYLKVGLVADALHTARTGVAKHPGYLAGQRALAMACNASGLHDESRVILEKITAAMPEDVEAQKTLASLYVATGDSSSAIRTYRTVLDFRPDDKGSAVELEALLHGGTTRSEETSLSKRNESESVAFAAHSPEDEIIDLSESDIFEEPAETELSEGMPPEVEEVVTDHHDPLSTLTLAELYEQQGFLPKALAIYRTILSDDPGNAQLIAKIAQLEGLDSVAENIPEEPVESGLDEEFVFSEPETFVNEPLPFETQLFERSSEIMADVVEPEYGVSEVCEVMSTTMESKAFEPLANKAADNVVDTLDGWLENIRRIKACR